MSMRWYYAHDAKKLGPFSQQQLKELAAAGTLLPRDTVWLEGIEQGVLANRVKNLFPLNYAPALEALPAPAASAPAVELLVVNSALVPLESDKTTPKPAEKAPRKGRAVALKGADIVGQDGVNARFRKKCPECGHKDSSCHSIVISNKLIKDNFFCPKCRRRREVAIQCQK